MLRILLCSATFGFLHYPLAQQWVFSRIVHVSTLLVRYGQKLQTAPTYLPPVSKSRMEVLLGLNLACRAL